MCGKLVMSAATIGTLMCSTGTLAQDAVVRKFSARELCSEPLSAPTRRANYRAAYERHHVTIDTISRLDWRTDTISQAQMRALNTAKRQINRAEVIDLAIALRTDFGPPAGSKVDAVYRDYATSIDRVASQRWETSELGEEDAKKITEAGQKLLWAKQIAMAELLSQKPAAQVAAALTANKQHIQRLAAKDPKMEGPSDDEEKALAAVVDAHQQDVARALATAIGRPGTHEVVRNTWNVHRQVLQRLAGKSWKDGVSGEEHAAVCSVLAVVPVQ